MRMLSTHLKDPAPAATDEYVMELQRNNGENSVVVAGTFIKPEVVWNDSFLLEYLGEDKGKAYFRAHGSWIENNQQSMNPLVQCPMSDFISALNAYQEAGVLAAVRGCCKRSMANIDFNGR